MTGLLAALLLGLVGCAGAGDSEGSAEAAPLRIAAASDLAIALPELVELFKSQHPQQEVSLTLGSSGLLARQVAQGAPFDLLFSANVDFVDELIKQGQARSESRGIYAQGRVVVWSRSGAVEPVRRFAEIRDARFGRIALANPEHAPYGLAGKQALINAGHWEAVQARVVYSNNIAQTLQFISSGNAEVGIIALALAMHSDYGEWLLISEELHDPIDQGLVITRQARNVPAAEAFRALVLGDAGRLLLLRHGFVLPGDSLPRELIEAAGGRFEP